MFKEFDFSPYFYSPEVLANKVLELYFDKQQPSYPINPFKMLQELNVVYQFRNFRDLEGIYLVPEESDDIPIVGININRPITRQRFTAAHELCHHLKDRTVDKICPIDGRKKDPMEKFADEFASKLLMPKEELQAISNRYVKNGFVNFADIIHISDYFGVSFESCVFSLAYKLNRINGDTNVKELKKRIKKFKPNKKREEQSLSKYDINLLRNIINSYTYFFDNESKAVWYKFKNDFIYNENRLEGVKIDLEDISEILTDIRIHKQESEYCKSTYKDIIEVIGHATMYDYLMETEEKISAFKMLNLNKMLFQYAPFPDEAGKTRTTNNFVLSAKFETCDWRDIPKEIVIIDTMIQDLLCKINTLTTSEYIDKVIKIHHKITVVHPFGDGNGRVSRVMLNWLFKMKSLPLVYLKYEEKEEYYKALEKADLENDFSYLSEVFYKEILKTMIQLNSKFIL